MAHKVMPFQREAAYLLDSFNGRALLADDMGLAKTTTVLFWASKHKEIQRILVVCPASLKWHWKREAWHYFGIASTILASRDAYAGFPDKTVTIINYDIIYNWEKVLLDKHYDLIILDECHLINNPEIRRSKSCKRLCKEAVYVIAMSGTPITIRHGELWAVLNMIRPDLYPSRFEFGLKYCQPRKEAGKWIYKGNVNSKQLHMELTANVMIRRTKDEVIKDLPPKTRQVVPVDISDRNEYALAEKDFRKWFKTYNPSMPTARIDGRVHIGYLLRIAARLKLLSVKEWIDNYFMETKEKLIVFAINRSVIQALNEFYPKVSTVVNGAIIGQKRQNHYDQFNTDDNCRLFLGNIQAASEGWSAKRCSDVAFVQLAWKPGPHAQGEDRCRGISRGIKGKPMRAWYLVAHGTVEEDLCDLLQKRQKTIDTVLDNNQVYMDFDLYDSLMEKLRKKWL